MKTSESIIELSKSLLNFHKLVGKISKDAKNPFFKSNYASLPNILEEINDPLIESGLVLTQFPDGAGLTTTLIHADTGQFMEAKYDMPVSKQNDPQALGSAISYARRYAVTSILSLKIDDDDAEKAMNRNSKSTKTEYDSQTKSFENDGLPWLNPKTDQWSKVVGAVKNGYTLDQVKKKYRLSAKNQEILLNEVSE